MAFLRGPIAGGVRNPVFSNALMVAILAWGVFAAMTLVKETFPEFSIDRIAIEVPYPGASSAEVEQAICTRVEEALEGLRGVKYIYSYARENSGLFVVRMKEEYGDAQEMMLNIKDRIERIDTFPPEVEKPVVYEIIVRQHAINLAIYGQASERTLKEWAQEIKNDLQHFEVISTVETTGLRDYEIAIQLSREALQRYGLSLQEVQAIVARNCLDAPAGTLRTSEEELSLRTVGQRYTARDFEEMVLIARPDGTLITLGQVADVRDGFEQEIKQGRFNGQPAAMLSIFKTPGEDVTEIVEQVRAYVDKKKADLPGPLNIEVWADNSKEVEARLDMLISNGAMGMVLVVLVLSLFMDFRISLYVAIGIPVSFAGALIVMHYTGETLNMLSLFGLIMVSGIIVDDAIVIADSYRLRRAAGDAPQLAAVEGPARMVIPVLASSLTTILAFVPLMFVIGVMGKLILVLPIVVISSLVFSAIEAFCILPSHLQHCLHERASTRPPGAWLRLRERIERGIDRASQGIYRPLVEMALRNRGLTLAISAGALVVTLGLVAGGRPAFTLLPEIDADTLSAKVRLPQGMPLERAEQAVRRLEEAAAKMNDLVPHEAEGKLVRHTFSVVGQWSNYFQEQGSHLCEVIIELAPAEQRRVDSSVILAEWSKLAGPMEDALTVTYDRVQTGPNEKPVDIRLMGEDIDELNAAAEACCRQLRTFAGVSEVEQDLLPGKREIRVRLKPLARTLGITLEDLARQMRSGFYGGEAVRVQRGEDEVRVQVRYPDDERKSIGDIERMRIKGAGGREIPFSELADFSMARSYSMIFRQNGVRSVRVLADVDTRYTNAEQVLNDIERQYLVHLSEEFPGVEYVFMGQRSQIVESLDSLIAAFWVAIVGIYAVLASVLRSYVQPFIIMAAIPLGFVGAVAGHLLLDYDLTMMSLFGVVALSGVVVNDSTVLLDELNALRAGGMSSFSAAVQAGQTRFRAVLLTTITTIAGLTPLMLERSTQAQWLIPMAVTLVFGLVIATVLTLVIVPTLYLVIENMSRAAAGMWHGRRLEEVGNLS